MKKALLVVLATIASFLALTIGQTAFAADSSVDEYGDVTIVLPFEKVWADNDNESGMRPESITVKLYHYTGDTYSEGDLVKTATVTAANGRLTSSLLSRIQCPPTRRSKMPIKTQRSS